MEKKQTAVEWYSKWISENPYCTHIEWRENLVKALQMEKEQIENAFTVGVEFEVYTNPLKTGKEYYTETYGNNN